jgi:hypothetical protein
LHLAWEKTRRLKTAAHEEKHKFLSKGTAKPAAEKLEDNEKSSSGAKAQSIFKHMRHD